MKKTKNHSFNYVNFETKKTGDSIKEYLNSSLCLNSLNNPYKNTQSILEGNLNLTTHPSQRSSNPAHKKRNFNNSMRLSCLSTLNIPTMKNPKSLLAPNQNIDKEISDLHSKVFHHKMFKGAL